MITPSGPENRMKTFLAAILLAMLSTVHAQSDITTDLIAYYPFNGNANDESGNDNHGTVNGAVLTIGTDGNADSAYEFNGINSYISVPGSDSLKSPSTEITMIALIHPYGLSKVGSAFGPILMKSNSTTNAFQYRLSIGSVSIGAAFNNWTNSSGGIWPISFNRWHAVAMTLKGDTAKFYLNGKFIGEDSVIGGMIADDRTLEIGRDTPGALEVFNGKIDEIKIYSRELTIREVQLASGYFLIDSFESPQ